MNIGILGLGEVGSAIKKLVEKKLICHSPIRGVHPRPVLKHIPGKIGGHCIIANCETLKKSLPNQISSLILKLNKTY